MPNQAAFPTAAGSAAPGPNQPQPVTPKNPNSTQNTLMFEELRDNMVIMGDSAM
jgi:hypothetical protein